jgi:hypothetical protein
MPQTGHTGFKMLGLVEIAVIAFVAALVLVPLAREYVDLRRSAGFGRIAALAATLLVLPSLAVGWIASSPLAAHPPIQWSATVVLALLVYSLGVAAVRSAAAPGEARAGGR